MPSGGAAMEADAKVQQELADALLAKAWSGRTAGALRRLRVHTHARTRACGTASSRTHGSHVPTRCALRLRREGARR